MTFIRRTRTVRAADGSRKLEYDLRVYYVVDILGLTANGYIAYDVDFWPTKASHARADPPTLQNSFLLQPTGKSNTDYENLIYSTIEDYIVRASLRGEVGNQKDSGIIATKNNEGMNVFSYKGVRAMAGKAVEKL